MFQQGHSSYITHLDWSPDNNFIMSNSGDYEILYCEYLLIIGSGTTVLCTVITEYCNTAVFGWCTVTDVCFQGTFQTLVNISEIVQSVKTSTGRLTPVSWDIMCLVSTMGECVYLCVCVLGCLFWRCLYFPDCWIRTTFLTLKFCLPISGVWPEGSDGTDINALIRSHNRKVIALADDFCKVHLFAYPCSTFKVTHIKTHIWKC